jgi:hypothetical protein
MTSSDDPAIADPIFVLSCARSGSTLLRYCIDSHPDIASPPETNLAGAFAWIQDCALSIPSATKTEGVIHADRLCRQFADSTVGAFTKAQKKKRWCEKSLMNLMYASMLERIFPEARFLCLFRECTDMVMSGIDASPWGYGLYGFADYVRSNPESIPYSLVRYWTERTASLQHFVRSHPANAYSIRYEDLVSDPNGTLRGVYEFLGYSWDPIWASEEFIFSKDHSRGRGDYKIQEYKNFVVDTGARGWRLPRGMITGPLRAQVDQLLRSLEYPMLDRIFDIDGYPNNPDGDLTPSARSLRDFLQVALEKSDDMEWNSGSIAILVRDELASIEFNPPENYAGSIRDNTRNGKWTYALLTDALTARSISNNGVSISRAIRRGDMSVKPFTSHAHENYEQFYFEFSSLFDGGGQG